MTTRAPFEFSVVSGEAVREVVDENIAEIVELVAAAYRAHGAGQTVNPASQFLRFPDRPSARIIALPAHLGGPAPVSGIKWIASYPDNVGRGMPRASAVLLLNDPETGYPFACLEGSIISAARTAASATLGASWLNEGRRQVRRLGFVGAGIIARSISDFLLGTGWKADEVLVYDLVADYARAFTRHLAAGWPAAAVAPSVGELVRTCDLVVFATTAAAPHVTDVGLFAHHPRVLHISLRDLAPEVILAADNIVDDVDHCLTAATSPHLAEQAVGHRRFITGTIADLMDGRVRLQGARPAIFSPFGLGVLDLAVGRYVYEQAAARGRSHRIPRFFHERTRW